MVQRYLSLQMFFFRYRCPMILNKREKIEDWAKIRGWDVFSIVFKIMENLSLNVFINIVFIKKKMCNKPLHNPSLDIKEFPNQCVI